MRAVVTFLRWVMILPGLTAANAEDHIGFRTDVCRINHNRLHKIEPDLEEGLHSFARYIDPLTNFDAIKRIRGRQWPYRSSCTSSIVNNKSGLVLTSMHCLGGCMIDVGTSAPSIKKLDQQCQITIDGKNYRAGLVASGECFFDYAQFVNGRETVTRLENEYIQRAIKTCPLDDDFAILQVHKLDTQGNCLEVNASPMSSNEKLASSGYPGETNRQVSDSSDSDGKSQYVTFGEVSAQRACEVFFENLTPSVGPTGKGSPSIKQRYANFLHRKSRFEFPRNLAYQGLVAVTQDILPGMSGGPTTNTTGEIRGINTAVHAPKHFSQDEFQCVGASFVLPMSTVFEKIAAQRIDPNKIFSCEPAPSKPGIAGRSLDFLKSFLKWQ